MAADHPSVRSAGETLAGLCWVATEYAGSVPVGGTGFTPRPWLLAVRGRAALGVFVDRIDVPYVLLANSDSAAAQTITLDVPEAVQAYLLRDASDSWIGVPSPSANGIRSVTLNLEAGGFRLLRFQGASSGVVPRGDGPGLALAANPAQGIQRFDLWGVEARARCELVDAAGRRIWSRALPPGGASLEWRGERDDGGRATPGLYFVRVEDARGVTRGRFVWLAN
jgi:hypothetical protein